MHNDFYNIQWHGLSMPALKILLLLTAVDEQRHEGSRICLNSGEQLKYLVCTSGECICTWSASTLPYTHRGTVGEWSTIKAWNVGNGRQTANVPHILQNTYESPISGTVTPQNSWMPKNCSNYWQLVCVAVRRHLSLFLARDNVLFRVIFSGLICGVFIIIII